MAFADLPDVYLKDFGVPCLSGAYAFLGIFDKPDETMNMAGVNVESTMYTLLVKTSDVAAGAIVGGGAITVAGTPYAIRDIFMQDDGLFSQLTLSF
jgi:hypothetical protein